MARWQNNRVDGLVNAVETVLMFAHRNLLRTRPITINMGRPITGGGGSYVPRTNATTLWAFLMGAIMNLSCFNWIQIIKKNDLPANAKLIAFYLSTFMNAEQDIAWPAQSRISHETGLTTPTVRKYLKYLEENGWLIIKKSVHHVSTGRQNYYHNEYLINIPQRVISLLSDQSRGKTGDEQGVSSSLPEGKELSPNNNRNNKVSNNKESKKEFSDNDFLVAEYIFSLIKHLNPSHRKPNFESWAKTIRLMCERDERSHEEIKELFEWANNHHFWQSNILSPGKLREQWDKLTIQQQQKPAANKPKTYDDYMAILEDENRRLSNNG